ncbi:hypothetical protein L249_2729, partial [Ophiocordyceps polyrhachis-furcata BCC 54312]
YDSYCIYLSLSTSPLRQRTSLTTNPPSFYNNKQQLPKKQPQSVRCSLRSKVLRSLDLVCLAGPYIR